MSYITNSKKEPFALGDFYNHTQFSLRSSGNGYKICHVLLNDYNTDQQGITTISVTIWESLRQHGRHTLTIEKGSSNINMRELLIEISAKLAHNEFNDDDCYIEVSMPTSIGKRNFTF